MQIRTQGKNSCEAISRTFQSQHLSASTSFSCWNYPVHSPSSGKQYQPLRATGWSRGGHRPKAGPFTSWLETVKMAWYNGICLLAKRLSPVSVETGKSLETWRVGGEWRGSCWFPQQQSTRLKTHFV